MLSSQKVPNVGKGVLLTIHQTSSEIFDDAFDRLQQHGSVMYQGSDLSTYFGIQAHNHVMHLALRSRVEVPSNVWSNLSLLRSVPTCRGRGGEFEAAG